MAKWLHPLTSMIQLVIIPMTAIHFSLNSTREFGVISEQYPQLISLSFLITCLLDDILES